MKNIILSLIASLFCLSCGHSGRSGSTSNIFTVDDMTVDCQEENVTGGNTWYLKIENDAPSTNGPSTILSGGANTPLLLTKEALKVPLKLPFGTFDGTRDGKAFTIEMRATDNFKNATVGGHWFMGKLHIDSKSYDLTCSQSE